MNVLSLFDGMSCGQQALRRSKINVTNYFASEIEEFAIQVTMTNFPKTIQLGDVKNINASNLPQIDLLIGGSPCHSFSFAGKRNGMSTIDDIEIINLEQYLIFKNSGCEFVGTSYLFWEYVRLFVELKPKYFFLENVIMEKKWENIISQTIGVNPIQLDSSLVSAQSRKRLYWTNIGMKPSGLFGYMESIVTPPKDKFINLKDIVENVVDDKYFLWRKDGTEMKKKKVRVSNPSLELIVPYLRFWRNKKNITIKKIEQIFGDSAAHHWFENVKYASLPNVDQWLILKGILDFDDKFDKIMTDFVLMTDYEILLEHKDRHQKKGNGFGIDERTLNEKSITLTSWSERNVVIKTDEYVRRVTPKEMERLQTIDDDYTKSVPESNRYIMCGRGWTIDIVSHIFNYLNY
jgi:site-specific DNA-cytosine methylase